MDIYTFLSALPAILAVAAFVAYRVLAHEGAGNAVTAEIVKKLRSTAPDQLTKVAHLRPKELARKIQGDQDLRKQVNAQDAALLQQLLRAAFIRSLVAYGLIGGLCIAGIASFVYLQARPVPLTVSAWHLESDTPDAGGLAVDLDPLRLTWISAGPAQDLRIALENVQTGRRSEELAVASNQHSLLFPKGSYRDILDTRSRGQVNRVRAVARSDVSTFRSDEFALKVGISVLAFPQEEDSSIAITALIDNRALPGYAFQARVTIWPTQRGSDPLSFGESMKNPKTVFPVPSLVALDLHSLKIMYFGPDDPRLVRTGLLGGD